MSSTEDDLNTQRVNALALLGNDTGYKAVALRKQITAIDPAKATRREKERLAALCRRVAMHHIGLPKKQFNHRPQARPQNGRGTRGRRS